MAEKYLVCNTVKMYATHVGGRVHSAVLNTEVPNGQFVFVGKLKDGEREIRDAVLPTADKISKEIPMLVMKPEINESEQSRKDGALGIFRNRAGKAVPALPLADFDEIELSADFFKGGELVVGNLFKLTPNSYELTYTATAPADKVYFEITEVRDAFHATTLLGDFTVFPVAHKMVTVQVHFNNGAVAQTLAK